MPSNPAPDAGAPATDYGRIPKLPQTPDDIHAGEATRPVVERPRWVNRRQPLPGGKRSACSLIPAIL